MWQVQYDTKGDNRIETFLNLSPLVSKEKEINGRFTLHKLQYSYRKLNHSVHLQWKE